MPSPFPGMDPYYEHGGYDVVLDYAEAPPPPALTEAEGRWVETVGH